MPPAESHLRLQLLARLIERAAASERLVARVSLVAGVLSLLNATLTVGWLMASGQRVLGVRIFVLSWAVVLILSAGSALLMLARPRSHLGSPEWREAFRCVFPAIATAVGATALFFWNGAAFSLAVVWITCYGLALLATRHFSPPSIGMLGSVFLVTGISMMLFVHLRIVLLIGYSRSDVHTAFLMGATFGLYHLVYGLAVLRATRRH